MIRSLLAIAAGLLWCSVAVAAPAVPGRAQLKGDVVKMNEQFHISGWNYRIKSIRWVTATDPFIQKTSPGDAAAPNGYLVFEVPVKNTQSQPDAVPQLYVTVFYKDGTSKDSGPMPYSSAGNPLNAHQLYPGAGTTARYVIVDVPQPTNNNPVDKLILKGGTGNDPGYPPVYRLLDPLVTP